MTSFINIIEPFIETVHSKGNNIAIIEGKSKISFKDLYLKSLSLAKKINSYNFLNEPIAVIQKKTANSIISNISILLSGNAYMNIDINLPKKKIQSILKNIKPKIIIIDSNFKIKLNKKLFKIINIDSFNFTRNFKEQSVLNNIKNLIDTDPLCIINTSGSTGDPKSVILNHKSFIDFIIRSDELFKFKNNEIIGSLSSNAFDIYSFELTLMMYKGSSILIIPEEIKGYPLNIVELIKKNKVSFIFWVPTIMTTIANLNLLKEVKLNNLKIIWFAGEVFQTDKFNYWRKMLPHAIFANLYGPIEITLDCSYYIIKKKIKNSDPIPIGTAYKNTDLIILKNNKIAKENEIGELFVRGSSLAMGYFNNEEETKKKFIQNPLNNSYPEIIYATGDLVKKNRKKEIIFIGRKDNQIKHYGHRIELDEIEHIIINKCKLVKNGCAVYNDEIKKIIFYYENNKEININNYNNKLKKFLTKYSLPDKWIKLNKLPQNLNGKIDRLKLKKYEIKNIHN